MTLPLVWLHGPPGRADSEELRYSIRSTTWNMPHSQVWVVGHVPDWLNGQKAVGLKVSLDDAPRKVDGHQAVQRSVWAASWAIKSDFILMNDDFFLTRPVKGVVAEHRGDLRWDAAVLWTKYKSVWAWLHVETYGILGSLGIEPCFSYELHRPMVVNGAIMHSALNQVRNRPVLTRSLYGNMASIGGVQVSDQKIFDVETPLPNLDWVSTDDRAFNHGQVGRQIRELFPDPSPYEKG